MADTVERDLTDLGRHLSWPDTEDLAPSVRRSIAHPPPHRRRLGPVAVGAVVALVLATITLLVPDLRRAVASRFGLGAVSLTPVERLPEDLGTSLQLGSEVPFDQAAPDLPLLLPDLASTPRVFVRDGSVALVYGPDDELPATPSGVGLLVVLLRGEIGEGLAEKMVQDSAVHTVQVRDRLGYWIEGPHTFAYLDPAGLVEEESTRLAASTLLWSEGGYTVRLESALDLAAALRIAEGMRPH